MAYIVVATEYLTKWAEVKAVKTDTVAHDATFMYENIIFRFGCLNILVGNRGTHFLNSLIQDMTNRFQIDLRNNTLSSADQWSDGVCPRDFSEILRNMVINSKQDWDVKLTSTLWAYRTTFKVTTHATPFSFVFGIEATLPIEFQFD